jgi:hypothetical protein
MKNVLQHTTNLVSQPLQEAKLLGSSINCLLALLPACKHSSITNDAELSEMKTRAAGVEAGWKAVHWLPKIPLRGDELEMSLADSLASGHFMHSPLSQ